MAAPRETGGEDERRDVVEKPQLNTGAVNKVSDCGSFF